MKHPLLSTLVLMTLCAGASGLERGDAIYRDGAFHTDEMPYHFIWHAGLSYWYDHGENTLWTLESAGGLSEAVRIATFDQFVTSTRNYMGNGCKGEMSKGVREVIINKALEQIGSDYWDFQFKWKTPKWYDWFGFFHNGNFRCDGLVH